MSTAVESELEAGDFYRSGDDEFQVIETDCGLISTRIGDRELGANKFPDAGDGCIRPTCDGTVKEVHDRLMCSEGCLEWLRTVPAQGDACDKYGDKCDGTLQVTENEGGSVEYECDTCSKRGFSSSVRWREAYLPSFDEGGESNVDCE